MYHPKKTLIDIAAGRTERAQSPTETSDDPYNLTAVERKLLERRGVLIKSMGAAAVAALLAVGFNSLTQGGDAPSQEAIDNLRPDTTVSEVSTQVSNRVVNELKDASPADITHERLPGGDVRIETTAEDSSVSASLDQTEGTLRLAGATSEGETTQEYAVDYQVETTAKPGVELSPTDISSLVSKGKATAIEVSTTVNRPGTDSDEARTSSIEINSDGEAVVSRSGEADLRRGDAGYTDAVKDVAKSVVDSAHQAGSVGENPFR